MISSRLLGVTLSVVGFGVAVAAGLFLAIQLSRGNLNAGSVLLGAGLAFIPVAALVGAGMFLYVRNAPAEAEPAITMRSQRNLLDLLKSQGKISLPDVARDMNLDMEAVRDMARELIALQIMSGYVNWDEGVLCKLDGDQLRLMERCQSCESPIDLSTSGAVTCPVCQTEYFVL